MKRSKVFLALTTGLLAVVAVTTAKASKFLTQKVGYVTAGTGVCNVDEGIFFTKGTGIATANAQTLRTIPSSTSACSGKVLYTKALD